jgi:hypothetical protein
MYFNKRFLRLSKNRSRNPGPLHGAIRSYVISETWLPLSFDIRPKALRPRFSPGLPFRFFKTQYSNTFFLNFLLDF